MLLSVAAGIATIVLKMLAWRLTGSTGLLSDALESIVNLAAALIALIVVRWATLPPDEQHMYGHEKAEYFSAGVEGGLIMVAAASIGWVAIKRLLHPVPLEDVAVGLAISAVASSQPASVLVRAGRRHRSITVEADGRHLLTDVWTSAGVIAGVAAVALTGLERLDPLIALAVAANIVRTGVTLVRRSSGGLMMDHALSPAEQAALDTALQPYRREGVVFHAIRNRQAGRRSFVSMHVLVPGHWTVQQGHDLLEHVEADVRATLPHRTVFTHIEPSEDSNLLRRRDARPTRGSEAEDELRPFVRGRSVPPCGVLGVWERGRCSADEASWAPGGGGDFVGAGKILQRLSHLERAVRASRPGGAFPGDPALVHKRDTPDDPGTAVVDSRSAARCRRHRASASAPRSRRCRRHRRRAPRRGRPSRLPRRAGRQRATRWRLREGARAEAVDRERGGGGSHDAVCGAAARGRNGTLVASAMRPGRLGALAVRPRGWPGRGR